MSDLFLARSARKRRISKFKGATSVALAKLLSFNCLSAFTAYYSLFNCLSVPFSVNKTSQNSRRGARPKL